MGCPAIEHRVAGSRLLHCRMAWRYQKRFSVLPGVRLKVRKGGFTATAGGRGAWYTFGLGRSRPAIGLPGSGISCAATLPAAGSASAGARGRPRLMFFWMLALAAIALAVWHWHR